MTYRPAWLAQGADKLVERLHEPRHAEVDFDVVIIGSGYGGAVAAARFARARGSDGKPLRVCVLERGAEYIPGSFPARVSEVPWHVRLSRPDDSDVKGRADGLFDFRLGKDVSALVGNGLGGGSLINAGVVEAPEPDVFLDKQWPPALRRDAEELGKMFQTVREMLDARPAVTRDLQKFSRLDKVAEAVGLHQARPVTVAVRFAAEGRNGQGVLQAPCERCGDCVTGCNFKAKNTLPMNYLAEAKALGAELYVGATASHVEKDGDCWKLIWRRTGAQHPTDKDPEQPAKDRSYTLRARHVVLSAGTFGSTEILLRSRAHGLHVSGKLGKRFSANGDMISVLYNERERVNAAPHEHQDLRKRGVGPTITGMFSTGGERADRVVVEELAVPGLLRRLFAEIVTTGALPVQLGRMDWSKHREDDVDPAAVNDGHIDNTQVFAAMGDDGAKGALELVEGWSKAGPDGAIRIDWEDAGEAPIYRKQDELLAQSEKLGGMYLRNPLWKPLPESLSEMLSGRKPGGKLLTVHPLGGCPMGEDWKAGVVDDLGQVYDPSETADLARVHAGLMVLDGSIVPVALGINPLLTIAALAERAVHSYIRLQGWEMRKDDARYLTDPPAMGQPRTPPKPDTAVRFAERMQGPLRFSAGGEQYETKLEVTFDDIGGDRDIGQFLRDGPHQVTISRGSLSVSTRSKRVEDGEREEKLAQEQADAAARRRILDNEEAVGRDQTEQALEALWTQIRDRELREERERRERLEKNPEQVSAEVTGTVQWMERGSSCAGIRTLRALWAYLRSRGAADFLQDVRKDGWRAALTKGGKILALARLASNVGETRYLRYALELAKDLNANGVRLPAKTVIRGLKTFRYAYAENPWQQLSWLKVDIEPAGGAPVEAGTLEVDLKHLIERFTAMLQITRQLDQPTAMLDVGSIALFMFRIVAKIHFWNFRAPEYEEFDGKRDGRRLPRPLDNLGFEVFHVWVQRKDKQGKEKPPLSLQLTRYRKQEQKPGDPVMLIHGFGSGGVQFAHDELKKNLVRQLAADDRDVWVAELRTSIALPSSRNQWTLDEVAKEDIPALVDEVLLRTGRKQVDIVAHCIGSAMFCTAVLGVKNEQGRPAFHEKIRSATLLQVGPLITLSPGNRFRGYMAAAMRRYMLTDHVDSSIDDRASALDTIIDRLLWTYPYPPEERHHHGLCPPWHAHKHIANCNRAAAVFGRLVQHDRHAAKPAEPGLLDHLKDLIAGVKERKTALDWLGDMIGHTNLTTFEQTGQYAFAERLTDYDASNLYVTDENVLERFGFPVRFIHGEKNDVFAVETSRRSLRLLQDLFRGRHTSDAVILEGYGHLDPLIAPNAHRDVYTRIIEFLRGDALRDPAGLTKALPHNFPRPPLIGPVLGWTRSKDGKRIARIWCRTDDVKSYAYFLIAVVRGGRAGREPAYMQPLRDPRNGRRLGEIDLLGVIDVPLPTEDIDTEIVIVGAHRSGIDALPAAPRQMITHPDSDIEMATKADIAAEAASARAQALDGTLIRTPTAIKLKAQAASELPPSYGGAVLEERKAWQASVDAALEARRVDDKGYFEHIDSVFLSAKLLAGLEKSAQHIEFALACCRYSASLIDRERADASFGVLRELITPEDPGKRAPRHLSLLLLVGDQIYADATAGLFDAKNRRGRFYDSYREVWTAPNARAVLRRLPTYMMMDDHEVADDWHPEDRLETMVKGLPDCRRWGLTAFEEYQLAHSPWEPPQTRTLKANGQPATKYWYDFDSGGFAFFVCDTRGDREGRERIISEAQMTALTNWMAAHNNGQPMFVVSPSVVLPRSRVQGPDDWSAFPASLKEMFSFIAREGIRNVVFLCGDSHHEMASEITVTGGKAGVSKCLCVLSKPLYAPMPFANATLEGSWPNGDVDLGDGMKVHYERRDGVGGDGVTLVSAQRDDKGWCIGVEVHWGKAAKESSSRTYRLG
jgi:cholesterol oxidase